MKRFNENNERIKRKYFTFLKQAKGQNEISVDGVAKAISRFEVYNKHKDFNKLMYNYQSGTKPLYKTPLYKNKKVFVVILIILLVMFVIVEVLEKEDAPKDPAQQELNK